MAEDSAKTELIPLKRIAQARFRLVPLTFGRFMPHEGSTDNPAQLDPPEIQDKCLSVLGYLEEYYRASDPAPDIKLTKGEGLRSLERQLDNVLQPHQKSQQSDAVVNSSQHQDLIRQKLTDLLAYPQVREQFEQEFDAEFARYQAVRHPMREVRDIGRITEKLRRAIYKRYLDSKQQHGKLTQSATDQIGFLQSKLSELEEQKRGVEETATPSTLGYLETQKLLEYKRELKEKGFVMTSSRERLIDRITREALAGKKIFLVGSTGTGKTQLAFYVLNNLTGGYELINWHEGTTPRDLFGYRELWTDESGDVQSGMKPGPIPKALEKRVGVIHEEYTGGSTRTQLAAKFMMGARPGDKIQIPGFNGQVFDVTNNFIEIFTGNPKDERTKQREEMDPAILRELTGIEVSYMPASEMDDIIRAMLIGENGVLKLSTAQAKYIEQLTKAAEMMQRIHNRDFEGFSAEMKSLLGIDAQSNTETTLNANFLDPGTLFRLFGEWELAQARGQNFANYMSAKLEEFINDPKTLSAPEERRTLQKILHAYGLITSAASEPHVVIEEQEKGYILPSEMAGETVLSNENPMGGDTDRKRENMSDFAEARGIMGDEFFGPDEVEKAFGFEINRDLIPDIPFSTQELSEAKANGQYLMLYVSNKADGNPITVKELVNTLQEQFKRDGKGKIQYDTSWCENEKFYTTDTPRIAWRLITKDVIPDSLGRNYLQQTEDIVKYLKGTVFNDRSIPTDYQEAIAEFERQKEDIGKNLSSDWLKAASQLAGLKLTQMTRQTFVEERYGWLVYFKKENKRLLENIYTWTGSQMSDGLLVDVGRTGAFGALVSRWAPEHTSDYLGVVLSR